MALVVNRAREQGSRHESRAAPHIMCIASGARVYCVGA